MKKEDIIEQIGQLAEQLDNALFGLKAMPMLPAIIHLQGLSGTMREVRDLLAELYKTNGGDEELNLQA